MMPDRILLLSPQIVNIGNGFVAKGARTILKKAYPQAEIIESSSYSYFFGDLASKNAKNPDYRKNVVGIGEFVEVDLVVFPGCILHEEPLRQYLDLLKSFSKSGTPILLLGVGGNDYKKSTQEEAGELLNECGVDALISRDEAAYEAYRNHVSHAEVGIDCAFFLSDWYTPPEANDEFIVSTFDKVDEPNFSTELRLVRPHHAPFDLLRDVYEGNGLIGKVLQFGRGINSPNKLQSAFDELKQNGIFVSDNVRDYLFFYSNATEIHADRIHACIPGLVYGQKIKFYYDTPRERLFDGLVKNIGDGFEVIKQKELERRKKKQIEDVIQAINGCT